MMKRTLLRVTALLLTSLTFFSYTSVAAASKDYVTVGFFAAWPEFANNDYLNNNSGFPAPGDKDIYTAHEKTQLALLLEYGRRWDLPYAYLNALSLGLQYQHMFAKDIGGSVTQYSDPSFLNYTYHLNLSTDFLLVNTRLDLFSWQRLTPFVSLGVGLVKLIVTDYRERALSGVTPRQSPAFARQADLQLAYQLGAGVGYQVMPDTTVAFNYMYQQLGSLKTNAGSSSWASRKLDFGNAYAHSFFITLTKDLAV